MDTPNTENRLTLRLFVLLLFTLILFIGIASSYYIIANSPWSSMDETLADTMKLFYTYASLLGVCTFTALALLVVDERRIRKLTQELEKEKHIEEN